MTRFFNRWPRICAWCVVAAMAAGATAQERKSKSSEPVLIFLQARDDAAQDAAAKKKAMDEQMANYAAAKKAYRGAQGIDSKVPRDELPALKQQLDEAGQKITEATHAWADAENRRRSAEAAAQTHGIPPQPDSPEAANPLGPSGPIHHDIHGGPLFQQLRDVMEPAMHADPTTGVIFYDGAAMPPALLQASLEAQREFARAEAERQRLEKERIAQEQRQLAAQETARRKAEAAAAAAARRQAEIDDLTAKINAHVDNAANVNVNDPAAVQRYNDLSDYYLKRYKELTGKDINYRYQRVK